MAAKLVLNSSDVAMEKTIKLHGSLQTRNVRGCTSKQKKTIILVLEETAQS